MVTDKLSGKQVDSYAYSAFNDMKKSAKKAGINLTISSAYRNDSYQQKLFDAAVKKYGSAKAARKWVATPGGSAHRTGRALDIGVDGSTVQSGSKTSAWLKKNAKKYGFYPYSAEAWHWEYNP
jgi:LAS superfamily LD-carboxypeptidase LdcB